ncbi:MAG: N-acetyl sugar amidotransferase [Deltaproteobacteria bacterium]|nr:N-acetyl sugar amidotransferase [Deltaproteobacteria bacterium]
MKYCKKCVQPDTRPGLVFDSNGVCAACRASEARLRVNWAKREKEIEEIAEWARKNAGGGFDCAVGVSGGKDSTFQALYVKERLGLNALLVNCAPDNISDVGRQNLENLVQHGFDMIAIRPNPKIERELSKQAFFKYGNFVKPLEYPLYASTYQIALKFGISLVVQGENSGETLGILEHLEPGGDALAFCNEPTVDGGDASIWCCEGIEMKDLIFYQYPNIAEMKKSNMRAIFLSHYAKEWSNTSNTEFAISRGLKGRPGHDPNLTGKINPYSSLDADLKLVNQMLKYIKFGFGATTDEVCYDIREGRMSREEGIRLVKQYDGKCGDHYIQEWCNYIGISIEEFWAVTDRWVNKQLFERDPSTGRWKPRFKVGEDFNED